MSKSVKELNEIIEKLERQLGAKGKGKKLECLELLRSGYDSISSIAEKMKIKNTNVSSLFSYLRKDGYLIEKVSIGGMKVLIFGEIGEGIVDVLGKKDV